MNLSDFMKGPIPGDLTLAEVRAYMLTVPEITGLAAHIKAGREVRIRFLKWPDVPHPGLEPEEFDDDTPFAVFRTQAAIGRAILSIDDADGGLRVKELV